MGPVLWGLYRRQEAGEADGGWLKAWLRCRVAAADHRDGRLGNRARAPRVACPSIVSLAGTIAVAARQNFATGAWSVQNRRFIVVAAPAGHDVSFQKDDQTGRARGKGVRVINLLPQDGHSSRRRDAASAIGSDGGSGGAAARSLRQAASFWAR